MPAQISTETYIGDAVYVSFDVWMIRLRTGDRREQEIFLEPQVWAELQIWWLGTVTKLNKEKIVEQERERAKNAQN